MNKHFFKLGISLCLCTSLLVGCQAKADVDTNKTPETPTTEKKEIEISCVKKYVLPANQDMSSLLSKIRATDGSGNEIPVNLINPETELPEPGKTGVVAIYAEDKDGNRKEATIEVEVKGDEKDSDKKDDKKETNDKKEKSSKKEDKTSSSTKEKTKETKTVKQQEKVEQKKEQPVKAANTPEPTKKPEVKEKAAPTSVGSKQERLKKAQEQVDKGSLGFFEDNGSDQAVNIIRQAQRIDSRTQLGAYGDATSLENMKRVFQYMRRTNYCRSIDPNNYGENKYPLSVTDELMALSQVQANHSFNVVAHWNALKGESMYHYVAENISWGYNDANDGWFTEEKANYEAYMAAHPNATQDDIEAWNAANISAGITDKQVGHYLTLVNPFDAYERRVNVFGYAIVTKAGTYGQVEHCSNYGSTAWGLGANYPSVGTPYSVDAYEQKFLSYYNRVMTELNEAKQALGQ